MIGTVTLLLALALGGEPLAGLEVTSTPPGAVVRLDGRVVGTTGVQPLRLVIEPGIHRIDVDRTAYQRLSDRIELRAGKTLPVHASLVPHWDFDRHVPDGSAPLRVGEAVRHGIPSTVHGVAARLYAIHEKPGTPLRFTWFFRRFPQHVKLRQGDRLLVDSKERQGTFEFEMPAGAPVTVEVFPAEPKTRPAYFGLLRFRLGLYLNTTPIKNADPLRRRAPGPPR